MTLAQILDLLLANKKPYQYQKEADTVATITAHTIELVRIKKSYYEHCLTTMRALHKECIDGRIATPYQLEPMQSMIDLMQLMLDHHDKFREPALKAFRLVHRHKQEQKDQESTGKS